jgi:TM2 domain-containing membrane protein YozV
MRNRTVAVLLAFFAGGFGIHKFYLGQNVAGILYFLFCWTLIPGIIAFFDFLGLLMMTEKDFDAQYNPGSVSGSHTPVLRESSREKVATLGELKKLYDAGIITAEEYEEKRRKYLDAI